MGTESRRDVRVPNESDGFVFTSGGLRASGLSPGDERWDRAVAACDLLPLAVESEDDANVRVVVGGALTAAEAAEWVGCVRGGLRLPDGQLALSGGLAWVLGGDEWAEDFVRIVEVPAGDYRATLYCYASAPNGLACLDQAGGDEGLGAWFRRANPGREMPAWLHNLCVVEPDLDPGFAKQWRRAREKRGEPVIDLLLHLEPAAVPLTAAAVADHGFAEAGECRRPASFPMGLPALDLEGAEGEDAEDEPEPEPEPRPVSAVAARPIAGGPVAVPLDKLARVARIAWFCHPYTHPSLVATFASQAPRLDLEGARTRAEGRTLHVQFDDDGQVAGASLAVRDAGRELAKAAGLVALELDMARAAAAQSVGRHRYAGSVEAGTWRLDAAYPEVDAVRLTEALALAEALENGRRFVARDEAEAARIEARVQERLADYFGANALQRTGAELALKRRDPTLFTHVLARAFWMRYASTWPLQDDDATE